MLKAVLPAETESTFISSLGHAELPFILTRIGRVHQTKPRKWVQHATVCYHTLIVYQVFHDVGRCVKSGSCSLSILKWKVNGQYWWDILLSQQMLTVIKHVVDDNIICLSATQLMHAPAHGVRNTVQQLLHKTLKPNFFWAMVTTGQSWTQSITRFSESTAAWIYVHTYIHKSFLYSVYKFNRVTMRCNMSCTSAKLKKSSSDWLNSGKTAIQHLSKKMWICVLPGSAAALLRWSRKISHCLNACCLSNITVKQYQNL